MRRQLVPAVLLAPAFVLAACSSAPPTENAQASSEALIGSCPAGTYPDCSGDGPRGQTICSCVQDTCTFSVPPLPAGWPSSEYTAWVGAWAVPSTGSCPTITLPTGRWAEIGTVLTSFDADSSQDVPVAVDGAWLSQSDCTQVPGMGAHCCTYVWWPNGYPKALANGTPDDVNLPGQDTTNLCLIQGGHNVAIEMYGHECGPDGGTCPVPGNGGCGSCKPVPP